MIRKNCLMMCFAIMLLLGACGKKDKEPETFVISNGENQINVNSINIPGGEADNEELAFEIGKEKSETIVIVVDWDKIIINDIEYSNIEEMEERIVKSKCKKIDLQHTDACKETLDRVIDILKEIEETLEIEVDYN